MKLIRVTREEPYERDEGFVICDDATPVRLLLARDVADAAKSRGDYSAP